jgi:hypothetical protein
MEGLSREQAFFLNEEIDRMDTSILDFLAEEDEPASVVMGDDGELDEL